MIYGQDIDRIITAHDLARVLLAGPDLVVLLPDSEVFMGDSDYAGVGRVACDGKFVYLACYFMSEGEADVAPDYQHFVDEPLGDGVTSCPR
jgi:hypothetical protein